MFVNVKCLKSCSQRKKVGPEIAEFEAVRLMFLHYPTRDVHSPFSLRKQPSSCTDPSSLGSLVSLATRFKTCLLYTSDAADE